MMPYFRESFGNPHATDHAFGWEAAKAIEDSAIRVAHLIGADSDEITFTSGATESNNLAILGLGRRASGGSRRRILIGATEHKCVLATSRILRDELGFEIQQIPVDREGYTDIPVLEEFLGEDVLLVSIMAVNNEIGTIQELKRLSVIIHSYGAIFHCDAAQAPCAIDLSSITEVVDLLSLSAHKMYGPKGIGALFIRRNLQDRMEPIIYGGGQQRGLRSGTVPVPLCVGMGAAAALMSTDEAQEQRKILSRRRDEFSQALMMLPWPITVNGAKGENRHPGNANMRFSGFSAHDILGALQPYLAASTGSACTSGMPEPSHVLKAIGLPIDEVEASIRFSLGFDTSDADLDEAVSLVGRALARLANAALVH